mmetsp:Transcript_912/g.2203  ORF Transcript_912/g.2203 Transcript_912/m.2203 type:complete len:218 (-) Transcript_912:376-1029(-)
MRTGPWRALIRTAILLEGERNRLLRRCRILQGEHGTLRSRRQVPPEVFLQCSRSRKSLRLLVDFFHVLSVPLLRAFAFRSGRCRRSLRARRDLSSDRALGDSGGQAAGGTGQSCSLKLFLASIAAGTGIVQRERPAGAGPSSTPIVLETWAGAAPAERRLRQMRVGIITLRVRLEVARDAIRGGTGTRCGVLRNEAALKSLRRLDDGPARTQRAHTA